MSRDTSRQAHREAPPTAAVRSASRWPDRVIPADEPRYGGSSSQVTRLPSAAMMLSAVGEAFVTILVAEVAGDAVRRESFAVLRSLLAEHGGREVRSTGDGLIVAFTSAVAATRCAVAMRG